MCTIGVVRNQQKGAVYYFKNVDQTDLTQYVKPQIMTETGYTYLKLPSGKDIHDPGVWAGVNSEGLVVLGADGNCMPDYKGSKYCSLNESLVIYEEILKKCASTMEAVESVMTEYESRNIGGNGDIMIIGDRKTAAALEYSPNRWGVQFLGDNNYMIRTNFFVLMEHLRPQPEENSLHMSSAIRYQDALEILSCKGRNNGLEDIFDLVRSHRHGPSALSICRHGGPSEYFTQCCLVTELLPDKINAYVALNEKPCKAEFLTYQL